MLTPEELNTLHLNITKYYKELEEYTISDIARRIAKSEAITETALHQIRALQNMNLDLTDIEKKIKEVQKISDKELDKLYDEAIKRNNEFNDSIREKADLFPYVPDKTNQMFMLANALKEQTKNDLWNFTQSLGFAENIGGKTVFKPIAQFYQDTLNFAQMQIQSGVADYNTAIKQAVNKLAKSGLRTVDYESGYSSKIETAVRRAVLTGISQLSGEMTKQVMKEFNTDLVEVSAHQGARDKGIGPENHKLWQGKVYSLSGKNKKYPSLVKVTGYGTGEGLKGWNCRHDFFPFIEGVSERTYTDEELENIDPPPFEYEGKTYTAYEATQMQRKLETAMRNEKLKIIGYESSGLEDEMTSSSIRLRRLKNYYEDFSSKAGLKTQYERTQAAGWGKKISSKSSKIVEKYNKYHYNKDGTIKVTDDWKDKGKTSILKKYRPNAVVETKTIYKNGFEQIDRSIYDENSMLIKQIHSSGHNRNDKHIFGKNKDEHFHVHEYAWDDNSKLIERKQRELTDEEKLEHKDILERGE